MSLEQVLFGRAAGLAFKMFMINAGKLSPVARDSETAKQHESVPESQDSNHCACVCTCMRDDLERGGCR